MVSVVVHTAHIQDRDGARLVLKKVKQKLDLLPRLVLIWADGGYRGELIRWVKRTFQRVRIEIIKRTELHRFKILPKRWVVERTFGWFNHYRQLSKDYEFHPSTSENMFYIAMIHLMLGRLH
jgi:putative transposase